MTTLDITSIDDIELVPVPSSPRGRTAELRAEHAAEAERDGSPSKREKFELQSQTLLLPRKQLIVCFCALSLALVSPLERRESGIRRAGSGDVVGTQANTDAFANRL
jgi:hypothetical protein